MRPLLFAVLLASTPARAATLSGALAYPDGSPAAQVAVWLEDEVPAGPSATGAPRQARLDEVWISFVPKVQVLPVGSTLLLSNGDDEAHTVHARRGNETLFNLATVPGGREQKIVLDRPGMVTVTCDLHREMRAYVVVTDSRASAVTGRSGAFTLTGVPAGRYRLRAWQIGQGPSHPGTLIDTVTLPDPPVTRWVVTPPPRVEVATAGAEPPTPAPRRDRPPGRPWLFSLHAGWPSGPWVHVLSALGIVGGILSAVGILRLGVRRRWSKASAVLTGCALAFACGLTVLFGLHGAVATALGFGVFIGIAIFGAREDWS